MEILKTSIHKIDHFNSRVDLLTEVSGSEIEEYLSRLISDINGESSKRKFRFRSNTTEVRSQLPLMLDGKFEEASSTIVNRLLPIESKVQDDIAHLGIEIQKGSFIQILIEDSNYYKIILSKADHSEFLDEKDNYNLHSGLPKKKKVFKAILINILKNKEVDEIFVYDTNAKISEYWWSTFLELDEVYTDSENSSKSFKSIDSVLSKIKKDYKADHNYVRNATITYYRSHQEFDLNNYVDSILKEYTPVDPNFPVSELVDKIEKLPEKKGFDHRFSIISKEIGAKISNKINLLPGMELHINGVENLEDVVDRGLEDDNRKFIKIYSDKGYESFGD